jgi:hypothetical protein
MTSRTSTDRPSAPLRKSTGRVATITRTVPVGPIMRRPSAPPSSALRHPRPDRCGSSRLRSQSRSSRQSSPPSIATHHETRLHPVPHRQPRARTSADPRAHNQLPHPVTCAASRTIAAVTNHAGEQLRRPNLRSCDDTNLLFMKPGPSAPRSCDTSTRFVGLVLASLSMTILNPTADAAPKFSDHDIIRKVIPAPLTVEHPSIASGNSFFSLTFSSVRTFQPARLGQIEPPYLAFHL